MLECVTSSMTCSSSIDANTHMNVHGVLPLGKSLAHGQIGASTLGTETAIPRLE
jgi:hypothetical protein